MTFNSGPFCGFANCDNRPTHTCECGGQYCDWHVPIHADPGTPGHQMEEGITDRAPHAAHD